MNYLKCSIDNIKDLLYIKNKTLKLNFKPQLMNEKQKARIWSN